MKSDSLEDMRGDDPCPTCSGSGICNYCHGVGTERCSTCNGSGLTPANCRFCGGSGSIDNEPCLTCGGTGEVHELCASCNGVGNFECPQCRTSGRCKDCNGTGRRDGLLETLRFQTGVVNDLIAHIESYRSRLPEPDNWTMDPLQYEVKVLDVWYEPLPVETTPAVLGEAVYINDTAAQASQTFSNSKSTQVSHQWQVRRGFRVGASATFRIGTPFIGGSATVSADVSIDKTETQGEVQTSTWSWSANIPVPPRSKVIAKAMLQVGKYNPSFRITLEITGYATWIRNHVAGGQRRLGFGNLFTEMPFHGVMPQPAPAPSPHPQRDNKPIVHVLVEGVFSGVEGIRMFTETKQYPLDDGERPLPAAVRIQDLPYNVTTMIERDDEL